MMKLKFASIFFVFCAFSCADEEISWNVDDAPEMLVIEGSFTNEFIHHRIVLSKAADYFINQPTPRVTGAHVAITQGAKTIKFEELSDEPGVYRTVQRIAGKPGKTYSLEIHLENPINNRTYYQVSEKMIEGIKMDSMEAFLYENPMYAEQSPLDSTMLLTYLYGKEPPDIKNLYSVQLHKNGAVLQDTIDEIEIYSDTEQLEGDYINTLAFFESFNPGDTASITLSTVSRSYQQYVTGIQNIANQSGNPFDLSGPPANAIGNIEGEALGYFRVSYVSTAQAIVKDRRAMQ
jgi:hypothetical protein